MSCGLVLMYHRIGKVRKDSIVPGHYVSERALDSQIRLVKKLGFPVLGPEATIKGERGALFTFDDGFLSFFDAAVPLFQKAGGSALVFLVTDCVGKTNLWNDKEGDISEPLMDWDQARQALKVGMHVGSHTKSHPMLPSISGDNLEEELAGSRARIEAELKIPCPWFCYPYGGKDQNVMSAVKRAGYTAAFATTKGAYRVGTDLFTIPRINVRADTPLPVFAYKIFRAVVLGR